ncbi:4'-phosphopantetheinyl transferase [Aaosphaeria arxii CBS 175.79]|uniref:holo-[acyl-carrier-protein] synthase n=1 Tax=Aaosphaeria arxii CBS 175.79 TaxID=1450172 RepID=A0A6A5XQM5_9PLEO|nr:4'-phosphopantetheinyl transferase [Aaosphaeria arxii CBS 175.79]KAF2015585.1 4'-phosphopantetheinyl transferase [Aaosphaeria arxii CBS 175.79]
MTRTEKKVELTCWLLDTRSLWPGTKIAESASEALQLISPEERAACIKKYHIADAKMSLASALLKRLFVSKTLGTAWKDIRFGRKRDPKHGKPCALLPDGITPAPVEFNISHQAGLVALIGCKLEPEDVYPITMKEKIPESVDVGVDIVCVNERNDYRMIDEEGVDGWVDMYAEIFSQQESFDMKYNIDPTGFPLLDGTIVTPGMLGRYDRCCRRDQQLSVTLASGEQRKFSSDLLVDAKLRRFYTYWCFKEAYIKLDGEALLANWIKELEFRNVRSPRPGVPARCSTLGSWGETVGDTEVWLKGKRLSDVRMEIQAFEENFMVGVAVKPAHRMPDILTGFKSLHLEGDIMDFARYA